MELIGCLPLTKSLLLPLLLILATWELIWKGFALWKAAQNNHGAWFVCVFIFNTAGILPIIYILLQRKKNRTLQGSVAKPCV